jgi:DNA-directed RNA polymerase specialized sigma24 family protein
MKRKTAKPVYTPGETICNLANSTGAEQADAEQEYLLAVEKTKEKYAGLAGAELDACVYAIAYNKLTDAGRKRARNQRREVSIHNENPRREGHTFEETIEDRAGEVREMRRERFDRLSSILRESGMRTMQLAQMCLDIGDMTLFPEKNIRTIQLKVREMWRKMYPHANSRDYYTECDKVRRGLRSL